MWRQVGFLFGLLYIIVLDSSSWASSCDPSFKSLPGMVCCSSVVRGLSACLALSTSAGECLLDDAFRGPDSTLVDCSWHSERMSLLASTTSWRKLWYYNSSECRFTLSWEFSQIAAINLSAMNEPECVSSTVTGTLMLRLSSAWRRRWYICALSTTSLKTDSPSLRSLCILSSKMFYTSPWEHISSTWSLDVFDQSGRFVFDFGNSLLSYTSLGDVCRGPACW